MPEMGRRRAAVLGSPISHSLSPQLHAAAYGYLGLDIDYTRIEVNAADAAAFLDGLSDEFLGLSVTMPLKSVMVGQMTSVSDRVATLGVLNTICVESADRSPGEATATLRLTGENTDVDGIIDALTHHGLIRAADTSLGIIGAGGTAAAAIAAAADLGFDRVTLYVRSADRAASLVPVAQRLKVHVQIAALSDLAGDIAAGSLSAVVSTLPPRAADDLAGTLTDTPGTPPTLLDVAYDPWPSRLARAFSARGWPVCSGKDMLLYQAVKQVELFTAHSTNPAGRLDAASHGVMVARMQEALNV